MPETAGKVISHVPYGASRVVRQIDSLARYNGYEYEYCIIATVTLLDLRIWGVICMRMLCTGMTALSEAI